MEGRQRRREEYSTLYKWSKFDLDVAKPTVVMAPSMQNRKLNNNVVEDVPVSIILYPIE